MFLFIISILEVIESKIQFNLYLMKVDFRKIKISIGGMPTVVYTNKFTIALA